MALHSLLLTISIYITRLNAQFITSKTATLHAGQTNNNGAQVNTDQIGYQQNNQWYINYVGNNQGWNWWISFPDASWKFYSDRVSILTLTVNSGSAINDIDRDILFSFSTTKNSQKQFFTTMIRIDNQDPNIMGPSCDTKDIPTTQFFDGDVDALIKAYNSNRDRLYKTTDGYQYENIKPNSNMSSCCYNNFPLQMQLINNPIQGWSKYVYTNPSVSPWQQICGFESFSTDNTINIYISADEVGEQLNIQSFELSLQYFDPTQPTVSPTTSDPTISPTTSNPTTTPTTPAPTLPAKVSTHKTIWYEPFHDGPIDLTNWTVSETNVFSIENDQYCPIEYENCWQICAPNDMYRIVPTKGYKNVAFTFSIDPYANNNAGEYCELSYSFNNSTNWIVFNVSNTPDRYIDATFYFNASTWDNDGVGIRLLSMDGDSDCCRFRNWYLTGIPITDNPTKSPTSNPTKYPSLNPTKYPTLTLNPSGNPTKNPSLNPTKNPSRNPTKYPSINPTKQPTDIPTLNPSLRPTFGSNGANPTINAVPSKPTADNQQSGEEVVVETTKKTEIDKKDGNNEEAEVGFIGGSIFIIIIIVIIIIFCLCVIILFIIWRKRQISKAEQIRDAFRVNSVNMTKLNSKSSNIKLQGGMIGVPSSPTVDGILETTSNIKMQRLASKSNTLIISSNAASIQSNVEFETNLTNLAVGNDMMMDDVVDEMQTPVTPAGILGDDDNDNILLSKQITAFGPIDDDTGTGEDDDDGTGTGETYDDDDEIEIIDDLMMQNTKGNNIENDIDYIHNIPSPPKPPQNNNNNIYNNNNNDGDDDIVDNIVLEMETAGQ